jgi:DNA-binding GntR family transcriptional regulator
MIPATPLHHELARAARALWLAEATPPGTPVTEAALATRLSVSRTPLRSALRLLEQAGIVRRDGRATRLADPARDLPDDAARDPAELLAAEMARAHAEGTLQDPLREADLMRQFGQPRGVVARALAQLAKLGMVVRNPAQGWRFAPGLTSPADRAAAHRFRLVLEPAALLEPGYRLDPALARSLRAAHEAVLARRWQDRHAVGFFEMNAAFHAGLAAGSGNRFFVDAVEAQNRLRALRNADWRFGAERARASCREHLRVLDALEAGSPQRAAALLVEHLLSAGP